MWTIIALMVHVHLIQENFHETNIRLHNIEIKAKLKHVTPIVKYKRYPDSVLLNLLGLTQERTPDTYVNGK